MKKYDVTVALKHPHAHAVLREVRKQFAMENNAEGMRYIDEIFLFLCRFDFMNPADCGFSPDYLNDWIRITWNFKKHQVHATFTNLLKWTGQMRLCWILTEGYWPCHTGTTEISMKGPPFEVPVKMRMIIHED